MQYINILNILIMIILQPHHKKKIVKAYIIFSTSRFGACIMYV